MIISFQCAFIIFIKALIAFVLSTFALGLLANVLVSMGIEKLGVSTPNALLIIFVIIFFKIQGKESLENLKNAFRCF